METIDRKDLPLTQLRGFEALGRTRSLTKAAAELGIPVGNLSKHVRDLEELLEVQLLSRSPRRSYGGGRDTPLRAARLV